MKRPRATAWPGDQDNTRGACGHSLASMLPLPRYLMTCDDGKPQEPTAPPQPSTAKFNLACVSLLIQLCHYRMLQIAAVLAQIFPPGSCTIEALAPNLAACSSTHDAKCRSIKFAESDVLLMTANTQRYRFATFAAFSPLFLHLLSSFARHRRELSNVGNSLLFFFTDACTQVRK